MRYKSIYQLGAAKNGCGRLLSREGSPSEVAGIASVKSNWKNVIRGIKISTRFLVVHLGHKIVRQVARSRRSN